MTILAKQVNPSGSRVFMGTITDKMPLHTAMMDIARENAISTGTFELLGGLHQVTFTAYDFEQQVRLEPVIIERPMEIIAGHGTISLLDNEPHIHLHLSLAYRDESVAAGIQVVGGHIAEAIAYAVEFTLTAYDGAPIQRTYHHGTSLKLWDAKS